MISKIIELRHVVLKGCELFGVEDLDDEMYLEGDMWGSIASAANTINTSRQWKVPWSASWCCSPV